MGVLCDWHAHTSSAQASTPPLRNQFRSGPHSLVPIAAEDTPRQPRVSSAPAPASVLANLGVRLTLLGHSPETEKARLLLRRRLTEHFKQHAWFAVAVDLLVVIVGILLALEVDAWRQHQEELRLERVGLIRLKEDLQIERARADAAEGYAQRRIEAARLLSRLVSDPTLALNDPPGVPRAIETASWRSFPRINAFAYNELQSSGRLALIRSDSLRRSLAEHYTAMLHDARVGEDLVAQQRFDAATSGLLSIDELEMLERGGSSDPGILKTTPERALALARAFSQRPAAIAELPSLVQHHTFNLIVIREMRERSDALVRLIDSLLGRE
jgi:hypothetical protein